MRAGDARRRPNWCWILATTRTTKERIGGRVGGWSRDKRPLPISKVFGGQIGITSEDRPKRTSGFLSLIR